MKQIFNKYLVQFTILLSAVILVWVSANLKWGDDRWNRIVYNDARGLYAYLPAIFIYQDLSFSYFKDKIEAPFNQDNLFYYKNKDHNNGVINKYHVGTSMAIMPFFLLGHLISWIVGNPLDGYSAYYLIFIQVATIFYALVGQYLLFRILIHYQISKKISALVIFSAIFATNIFYYVTIEPGMSHVYSFAFVTLFAYNAIRFFNKPGKLPFITAMFALGMVMLIRPVNVLILLSIPFLSGDQQRLKAGFIYIFKQFRMLVIGLCITIGIIFIQLIIYKIQTNDFIVYSYSGEAFDFTDPNILNFIISYRKGLLVYTPIFFISILGLFIIYKRKPFEFYSLVLFLLIVVYVLSSWWMWYYGGSFGSRAFIDYYVFLFIPLAMWLEEGKLKKLFRWLVVAFILICQIQTYQYQYGYLHWSEMTKELYWDNFLRIDKVINDEEKEW